MAMELRDFLFLDSSLVRSFLAQLEGGEYDEVVERQRTLGKGGIGARVGISPVGVSGEKSKETSHETEATIRQVAASEFDRLYTQLNDGSLNVIDEVSDSASISGLQRKQFIEVDGRFRVSGFQQLIELIGSFSKIAPQIEQLGTTVDKETLIGMQAFASLNGPEKPLPLVVAVPGAMNFRVSLELDRQFVRTDAWDVDATVLLKIQRIIRGDEHYVVGDPFEGLLKLMPDKDRNKMIDSFKSGQLGALEIGDIEITAPAIVGTPIAIYR